MTTVINNPGGNRVDPENRGHENESGGSGVVIGAVIVVLVLIAVIVLALPYVRDRVDGMSEPVDPVVNIQIPPTTIPGADADANANASTTQ